MRKLREGKNINTEQYFDEFYTGKETDFVNTLRQDKYLKLVEGFKDVVELGCGTSPFLIMAHKAGHSTWGVDFSVLSNIHMATIHPEGIYKIASATETGFSSEKFDAVVAGEVIEHMEDPMALVREMLRICKPGGRIVLSTPHLEFDDPEHIWEFDGEDLVKMFGGGSFEVVHSEKFPGRSYIFFWYDKP